ncbi:MAG: hypothetical protein K9J17_14185 [Flavobacteriales bacterium]|nr:hypothetical protein [Flavobacteriales bacterium]
MEILSKLTPAETHLVMATTDAELKNMMKYTFMDLLLKQVIQTKRITKQAHRNDRARVYTYVVAGKNFLSYKPLRHEEIFLSPFYTSQSLELLFRHLVTMGFQNADGTNNYVHKRLIKSPNLKGIFEIGFFIQLFGTIKLTPQGNALQREIKRALDRLETELPQVIHSDKAKALEILLAIGGNIFLLKNLDFALLNQIDSELMKEFKKQRGENDSSGCYGCGDWHQYDHYGDSFDSDYDAADASFGDSGCSSCSGCSGCSGCGGCGD